MLARGILGNGRTRGVSFRPFPNSSGWWWLISSVFPIRISCHKTTHANGYYGAWPGWAVSISVLLLTELLASKFIYFIYINLSPYFLFESSCDVYLYFITFIFFMGVFPFLVNWKNTHNLKVESYVLLSENF